jgi:hypothetical protein
MAIILTNFAAGQRPGPPPGTLDLKGEMRKGEVRETMLRKTDTGTPAEKVDPKHLEAAIEKVKEDFKQIQIIRNEIVRSLLANQPADYKFIAEKANQIYKRADRLKTYLLPPQPENKEKNQKKPTEMNQDELRAALIQMCNRLASFIDNPILKNPGLTDAQQSAKFSDDLLMIIDLSGDVKRSAERLKKGTN